MDDHLPVFVLNGYENLTLFKVLHLYWKYLVLFTIYFFMVVVVIFVLCWTTIKRASLFSRTLMILSWTTWALSTPARFKPFIHLSTG